MVGRWSVGVSLGREQHTDEVWKLLSPSQKIDNSRTIQLYGTYHTAQHLLSDPSDFIYWLASIFLLYLISDVIRHYLLTHTHTHTSLLLLLSLCCESLSLSSLCGIIYGVVAVHYSLFSLSPPLPLSHSGLCSSNTTTTYYNIPNYCVIIYIIFQDLSRTVGREVAKMDTSCFAPSVYGYRPKVPSGLGGAFGNTASPMQQQQHLTLTKVDIPFKPNMGLFHE